MPWVKDANGNTVWVNEGGAGAGGGTTGAPTVHWQDGIPWMLVEQPTGSGNWAYVPVPTGYGGYQPPTQYGTPIQNYPFYHTPDWYVNQGKAVSPGYETYTPSYTPPAQTIPLYDYPWMGTSGGGGGGPSYYQYDPFSQQLQAAQLQESIRQANLSAGYDRSKLLNDVLANPANVFSSWFQSRGQVPPYNAQLANILNLNTPEGGAGSPWFGAMPPLGQTPGIPGIPTPQPPQPIPYAQGGTYIPAEPAVAIGLRSGQPLFTFNENAPAQTENVKITPQKTPSFAEGGTAWTDPSVGMGGQFRGTGAGQTPMSGTNPWPLQDFYDRGGPQFPWLTNLGQGGMPGLPQLGNALNGFPVPSLQSLNQMTPSEQTALANWFNAIQGGPGAEDVAWAARLPFNNLRNAIPAQNRMG